MKYVLLILIALSVMSISASAMAMDCPSPGPEFGKHISSMAPECPKMLQNIWR
jgi:hypothetical protein